MQREIIYINGIKKEEMKLRVAAYVRVSSDSNEQLESYETQLLYYNNYIISNQNWQLVDVYCDEAISGQTISKRPEFLRMVDDCKRGKIDRIITKSLSRFARNTHDALKIVRQLKEMGVSVLFEKENIDTESLQGEVLLTTFSAFAQEELMSISQNLKQATRSRMARGEYVSPSAPYGYSLINNKLTINDEESENVKLIFNLYLNGKGAHEIAKILTEKNILTATGNDKWHQRSVISILTNERYKGDMLLQKSYTPDIFPLKDVKNKGEIPMYYVRNSHDAIIETEIFDKVQEVFKSKYQCYKPKTTKIFTQKIRCGSCGSVFRLQVINDKNYWICMTHNRNAEDCDTKAVSETDAINTFIQMYNKLKENYQYILTPMLKALNKLNDNKYLSNQNLTELNKEIANLSEQSHTLNGLISQGVLDSALFISEKDELNEKLRKLKAEKRLILQDEKDSTIEKTEHLIEILQEHSGYLKQFNLETFNDVVDSIKVYKDRQIGFILINGLEFKENLRETRR